MKLARRTPLKSSGRIKPKKRSASEAHRIYGPPARRQWITSSPCWYCGRVATEDNPSHQAHTENGGKSRKAGYATILPLCAQHHRMFDNHDGPFSDRAMREMMQSAAWTVEETWQAFQRSDAGGER